MGNKFARCPDADKASLSAVFHYIRDHPEYGFHIEFENADLFFEYFRGDVAFSITTIPKEGKKTMTWRRDIKRVIELIKNHGRIVSKTYCTFETVYLDDDEE